MGHYLTAADVRKRFVAPLAELSGDFAELCQTWEDAVATQRIARRDLLLNDVLPEAAIARLRKLLRETSGKLEDAVAGVYRYRKVEARQSRLRRREKRPRSYPPRP
jgi:predicted component of type VI protein secretion system